MQETPTDQRTFTRIVTSLVPATGQPLKREYYGPANRLWKVETFENVAEVHGVPTVQRVRMEDMQTGYGSEYRGKDRLRRRRSRRSCSTGQLPNAAEHAIWK